MKRLLIAVPALLLGANVQAQQVFATDLIVQGSECVGFDCTSSESFGFDTIRLKENNLRIKFEDTSTTSSFPTNDWQLTANDSANGGLSKFSIDDISGGRTPFTIEAGAPSHSLYVEDSGEVGFGTNTPVVELHTTAGDSPTLRLEQDTSSGFAAQTWDIAGNETSFFVRDTTNGSTLPFRIFPGSPSNALIIDQNGDVGLGTLNPDGAIHLDGTGTRLNYFESSNGGAVQIRMRTDSTNRRFLATDNSDNVESQIVFGDSEIQFAGPTSSSDLFATLNATGLTVEGSISTAASGQVHPDYVFNEDYELMPLADLKAFVASNKHLPEIPSADDVAQNGINITEMQIGLLKKVEELTLYVFQQQEKIEALQSKLDATDQL